MMHSCACLLPMTWGKGRKGKNNRKEKGLRYLHSPMFSVSVMGESCELNHGCCPRTRAESEKCHHWLAAIGMQKNRDMYYSKPHEDDKLVHICFDRQRRKKNFKTSAMEKLSWLDILCNAKAKNTEI